ATESERMYAYDESVRHLERVLEIWDRVEDPDALSGTDRIGLLIRGSQVAEWAGDAARALTLAEEARRAVGEQIEPLRAAAAETCIGRALWFAGRGDDAIDHLAKARQLVPAQPATIERADALAAEGRMLMLVGTFA